MERERRRSGTPIGSDARFFVAVGRLHRHCRCRADRAQRHATLQNARTLEDLVKEMLQPLLKTWLDDNLPGLVERLVRAEIERVSRGRG